MSSWLHLRRVRGLPPWALWPRGDWPDGPRGPRTCWQRRPLPVASQVCRLGRDFRIGILPCSAYKRPQIETLCAQRWLGVDMKHSAASCPTRATRQSRGGVALTVRRSRLEPWGLSISRPPPACLAPFTPNESFSPMRRMTTATDDLQARIESSSGSSSTSAARALSERPVQSSPASP